jgi:purine-nucleoside phosphorylase
MTQPQWQHWWQQRLKLQPKTAIVLGSGLGATPVTYQQTTSIDYSHVPHLQRGTVPGHAHRLSVGLWDDIPVILCFGRLHLYEGFNWQQSTALIRLVADQGVRRLILTNAAGSLDLSLTPGNFMFISAHYKLVGKLAWRHIYSGLPECQPYAVHLYQQLPAGLPQGVYAAVTGPSYETPAEVRALARCGARAVGMSTAWEAEEGHRAGLEVIAISYITNWAAGIAQTKLHHAEVLAAAQQAKDRLFPILRYLLI